jgi:hypothetical protein
MYQSEKSALLWVIYITNGEYYVKTPFSSLKNPNAVVVLSETDYVTSYDPDTNTYQKLIPSEDEMEVRKVPHIDKKLLDGLSEKDFGL